MKETFLMMVLNAFVSQGLLEYRYYPYLSQSKTDIYAMAYYTNYYYIFQTNVQKGAFRDKIPNSELCNLASARVNKYVSIFGKGKHPKDPEFDGQKFPYIIVDCEKQILKAVNMNKQ